MSTKDPKFKSTCINFQEVTKCSMFQLWNICEAYFLDQIEDEFENQ